MCLSSGKVLLALGIFFGGIRRIESYVEEWRQRGCAMRSGCGVWEAEKGRAP
jgi:hypothetical protein